MKKNNVKFIVLAVAVLAIVAGLVVFRKSIFADARERLTQLIRGKKAVTVQGDTEAINSREFLEKYFEQYGYETKWSDTSATNNAYRDMLIGMLQQADSLGLDRKDYHQDYIQKFDSLLHVPGFDVSAFEEENELIFTDAAISFLYHVAYGKDIPQIAYNGVKYNIDSARILNVFGELMQHHDWQRTLDSIEPRTTQYNLLKSELNRMQAFVFTYPALDSMVAATNTDTGRVVAIIKLKALGLVADTLSNDSITDAGFKAAVKGFQQMVGGDTTGVADAKTLTALNLPMAQRLMQLKQSLNYWRWTGRLNEKEFILVNIPAARLQIVNQDSLRDMSMRVIVGKKNTQTPSFTAYITRVITYPYWTVPISIATKEMLPKIRRSIAYLENNNLQVINSKGAEVDPKNVDWNRYSEKYFPYTLRQSTGCDNALGVLKFDLNSPYSVYLHDTNRRDLFGKKDRFMSHGCVRVEKPMELAQYVLSNGLDSATIANLNQCVRDQKPTEFPLKKKFPVLILYMPADIDENMHLRFYADVYEAEKKIAI
ncbi:MAG: hypothetical protein RLZZ367_1806 [Bacteroidota bacterium]|jgi:murein L,D-transpeptidase YcbB/YkuD